MDETTSSRFAHIAGIPALPKDLDARVRAELKRLACAQLTRASTVSLDAPSLVACAFVFDAVGDFA